MTGGGFILNFDALQQRVGIALAVCLFYRKELPLPADVERELALEDWLGVYGNALSGSEVQGVAHTKILELTDTLERCLSAFKVLPRGSRIKGALLNKAFRREMAKTFDQWHGLEVAAINVGDEEKAAIARASAVRLVETFEQGVKLLGQLPTAELYTAVFKKVLDLADTYKRCSALLDLSRPQDERDWIAVLVKMLSLATTYEQCISLLEKVPGAYSCLHDAALQKALDFANSYEQYFNLLGYLSQESPVRFVVLRRLNALAGTFGQWWNLRMHTGNEAGETHRLVLMKALAHATTLDEMLNVRGAAVYFPEMQRQATTKAISLVATVEQGARGYQVVWWEVQQGPDQASEDLKTVFDRMCAVATTVEDWMEILNWVSWDDAPRRERVFVGLEACMEAHNESAADEGESS